MVHLQQNISQILADLPPNVTLLAATKTVAVEVINQTYDMGIRVIGENRVNELLDKFPALDKRFSLHFIGALQSNKVKYIIDKVDLIHSLDRLSLAAEIDRQARRFGRVMDCLVEVNIGGEATKSGLAIENVDDFLREIWQFDAIRIRGLMAIPPKITVLEKNIEYFKKINRKFIDIRGKNVDNGNIDILSLGMSSDWRDAVACGSTMIRVGEGIFGERIQKNKK